MTDHDPGDEDPSEVAVRRAAAIKAAGLREIYPGVYAPIDPIPLVIHVIPELRDAH